jgi:alkylation response protein AidB-like acyl-CoA dehydrogenase
MDFDLPPQDDPRRLEVRAWLARNPQPAGRQVAEAGYAVPHWPRPWGLSADPELQVIIADELERANVDAPYHVNPVAVNNCAQSLLTHGTDAQRARFLPPALACEEIWCMLFSEPSAGSDLAALQTVARREGDH